MAETHLEVHVLLAGTVQPTAVDTRLYRPYESAGVLLGGAGAMEATPDGDTLGSGALLAHAAGVLATVASRVLMRAASPSAAEWAGKVEAWRLAETLGVAPAALQYVGAECTFATLSGDGGVPSQSPWVDRVRVTFAEALGRSQSDVCVPAQHKNQWSGLLSDLQASAHDRAAVGLGMGRQGTSPLPSALDGTAQLFSSRSLVTAVPGEMDGLYAVLAAPFVTFVPSPPLDDQAVHTWAQLVGNREVRASGLRPGWAWCPRPTPRRPPSSAARTARIPARSGGITWSTVAMWCSGHLDGF